MTPLEKHLRRRIALEGPMTVADFMGAALGHPEYGYYMTRDPFGVDGDFTTAPEISQMFGELIGLWMVNCWQEMGAPDRVHLVELGPGRGTLMADMLRAAKRLPAFLDAAKVTLVEMSPTLSTVQERTLEEHDINWCSSVDALPSDAPLLVAGNEFFDAIPIRQFRMTESGWREILIAIGPENDDLQPVLAPGSGPAIALIDPSLSNAAIGTTAEIAPASWDIADRLARRIAEQRGAALFIDYGYDGPATGDTLQALRKHKPVPVTYEPGQSDITAHVDFTALRRVFSEAGLNASPTATQGAFLQALGIDMRARTLLQSASPQQAKDIASARDRLIRDDGMGKLFKVIGVRHPDQPPLAGLEPQTDRDPI